MDVYQNIWTNCEKSQLEKHNQLISECVISQGLFQNEDDRLLKIHVREINSLLNNPKTRERGLRLLLDVVPQCAQQVLAEQCEHWFKFCSNAIAASRKTRSPTQACQVVTALLRDLPSLPELQRCVSSKSSAALVLELSSVLKDPAPLECLYEYLRAAPGQCLQHKKVLEERMLVHLDNPIAPSGMDNVTQLAGRVFAALPLPGIGGGNVTQARADARGRQLSLLLSLAHALMDTLLDGVVEKESHPHPREYSSLNLRPLEDITTDPVSSRLAIIARLSNTLTFIAEMVTDGANASITFAADHLLSVAFRLLQVESAVLARYKSQEHKLLAFFLPALHHQALLLLRDVITSLGEGADCFFNALGDLLTSVVQGSEGTKVRPVWCSGGQQTKVVAYAVLAELIKASRGRHTPPPALVTLLLRDVSPKEEQVKLQRQGKGLASLSVTKAAGKKKGYTITSGSASANAGPVPRPDRFSRLARVALVVAEMLFAHAAHSMALKDHQRLQEGVLAVAEVVVGTACPPSMYSDPRTRVQLFLTLASLSTAPHPRCPPPFTLLAHLFQMGLSDGATEVVSACQTALWSLSLVVANPKVELASRAFQQHNQLLRLQEEEEETTNTIQQEENEKEEDDKEEEKEEEEEPMIEDKTNHTQEEERKEEEVEEEEKETEMDEGKKDEDEEEEENKNIEDKNEEEKKDENNKEKEEEKEGEENQKKDKREKQKEEEEDKRSSRSRSRSMTRKRSQEMQRRKSKEGGEEEGRRGRNKRNSGNSDSPAKRMKGNSDQAGSKGGDGSSEFLTVEEMLKDFVE